MVTSGMPKSRIRARNRFILAMGCSVCPTKGPQPGAFISSLGRQARAEYPAYSGCAPDRMTNSNSLLTAFELLQTMKGLFSSRAQNEYGSLRFKIRLLRAHRLCAGKDRKSTRLNSSHL